MTDNEINQAIAEACGWTDLEMHQPTAEFPEQDPPPFLRGHENPDGLWMEPPNYVADLNAMAEAEKTLGEDDFCTYVHIVMNEQMELSYEECVCATARQRAEAFLRLKGKWPSDERVK